MSVAALTAREFAFPIAIAVRNGFATFPDMLELSARMAEANQAAYYAQYGELYPIETPEEIEREALTLLADKANPLTGHWGGIAYNAVTNNGETYFGFIPVTAQTQSDFDRYQSVEKRCQEWADNERRRIERKAEDDKAYSDVGPLPITPVADLPPADRYIVAEFGVNESDMMTDYYGGRTSRRVVIGFGTGKRESFKQLREAASLFPPTADMGIGRGRWTAYTVWDHDSTDAEAVEASQYRNGGQEYYKGRRARFEKCPTFETEAALDAWLADNPTGRGIEWEKCNTDPENRENYSMGGGNYLGWHRYGGWSVYSVAAGCLGAEAVEVYEPSKADLERLEMHRREAKSAVKPKPAKTFPTWSDKGYLTDGGGYPLTRHYRKIETAERDLAKILKLGIDAEIRQHRREYVIKLLTAAPATVEPAAPVETAKPAPVAAESNDDLAVYDWL